MLGRIMGLETEYGCLLHEERSGENPAILAHHIRNGIFENNNFGLIDLHHRAHDEPPGNGGFLLNGGRIYIDMGHIEYASPECIGLSDLVAHDRAGDQIIQKTLDELGLSERVSIIKNNIDHATGATFGSHENYLVSRDFPYTEEGLGMMIPFLVTRQLFTGAGRVGAHFGADGMVTLGELGVSRPKIDYQISQRADHIVNDYYHWIQFNRAIINTRDEPLADPSRFRRIHLLVGDSNMLEYATALKFGTTSLALALIEEGLVPEKYVLKDAVYELRQVSRDVELQGQLTLVNGDKASAIDIQKAFLEAAEKAFRGRDHDSDWVLTEWANTLEVLTHAPEKLIGKIDWISKRWLLESFRETEQMVWNDPVMASLDLSYHDLNPEQGLYFGLEEEGRVLRRSTDRAITSAMRIPPRNTRASARGELIARLLKKETAYVIDWSNFYIHGKDFLPMEDPFNTYVSELEAYLKS